MQEIPWEHRTNCVLQGTGIAWTQPPFLAKAQWSGQIANKRRHDKTELRSSELPQPRVKKGEGCIQSVQKTAAEEENQQIAELPRRAEQVGWVMQHPAFPLPSETEPDQLQLTSHWRSQILLPSKPKMLCAALLHSWGAVPQSITTLNFRIRNISKAVGLNLPILSYLKNSPNHCLHTVSFGNPHANVFGC